MAISVRKLALATAAALALFGLSSTEVLGQTAPNTLPPTFKDTAHENEYKAKMRRVITLAGNTPAGEVSDMTNARIIGFVQAIKKYNKDPVFQPLLINISEETLSNYARFVSGVERTDAKIRVVNSADEDRFRTLMVANGVIPNNPTTYGPAYQPQRRAPETKGSPALKDAPKK